MNNTHSVPYSMQQTVDGFDWLHATQLRLQRSPFWAERWLVLCVSLFFGVLATYTSATPLFAQAPPAAITIPEDLTPVKVDARCDPAEYGKALQLTYTDSPGQGTGVIYLKHDRTNIYLCIQGTVGSTRGRFFGVYLDTQDDRAALPQKDDFSLRVGVVSNTTSAFQGTGTATLPYTAVNLSPDLWEAVAQTSNSDIAEYRIARSLISSACSSPFGLAIYHQQVDDFGVDYGVPNGRLYNTPVTWLQATLANPRCVRVMTAGIESLIPAVGATVYRTADDAAYRVDNNGYVIDGSQFVNGDALWAVTPISATTSYTLYATSGPATLVTDAAFQGSPPGTLTLIVTRQNPLLAHNLDVSAEWYVEGDPQRAAWLRNNLILGAHYLYKFTNGQFTLGKITVHQALDGWDTTNLKLHVNNNFQPRANIGGIVPTVTLDISPVVTVTYAPGNIFMGSYWNRYGVPPDQTVKVNNQTVPLDSLQADWAMALAHELGHYLLFLFDTYTGVDGKASQDLAKICTGSAMGDVYELSNQAFIFDPGHWRQACSGTEAYSKLHARTEWDTIHLWYPWTIKPTITTSLPITPPVNLTTVNFVPPSTKPGQLAASQVFTLTYQDDEKSSGEARVFILRSNRVYEQGKPPKNATQVTLIDAEVGDRLCVYDINDHAENGEVPRHQFGCELIKLNDANLDMTKNTSWGPVVQLSQTLTNQLSIVVTQTVATPVDVPVRAQLYPEHGLAYPPITLTGGDGVYRGVFTLPTTVPPVYAQIWVSETTTNPLTRREVIVDRGTGGSGAFGPAKQFGGVLVVSSDGNASFESDTLRQLDPGESIAWQSMPGTPPLPTGKQIIGQSYRLDAYPTSLVASGKVHLQYEELTNFLQAAGVAQPSANDPVIYFWDGSQWRALPTTISTPADAPDSVRLATAPSQGVGVYAVLVEPALRSVFLPLVQR